MGNTIWSRVFRRADRLWETFGVFTISTPRSRGNPRTPLADKCPIRSDIFTLAPWTFAVALVRRREVTRIAHAMSGESLGTSLLAVVELRLPVAFARPGQLCSLFLVLFIAMAA